MDFDKIPNTIVDRIYNAYNNSHNLPPMENVYLFFEKYQMKSFMEDITTIENKLSALY
jgi:GTP-sensing pleiotropic transcriptional regulator CodY